MSKKPARKTLRNKADRMFSLYIRARDGRCQAGVGCSSDLQCAHIFGRRYLKVRWDPENAVALCAGHHKSFTHNPIAWEDWCIARMGEEAYRGLRRRATATVGKVDYESVIAELEELQAEVAA